MAEKLLCKKWFNTNGTLDTGKNANYNVDVLVKAYLSSANTKTISGLVGTLQKQAEKLERKEDFLAMLPSIIKFSYFLQRTLLSFTSKVRPNFASKKLFIILSFVLGLKQKYKL